MPSVITPALNETQAPFQFDSAVAISGTDIRGVASNPGINSQNAGGLIATNYATYLGAATGSAALTSGTLYYAMLNLAANTTVSNLWLNIITAANGLTSGQCFAGLYYAGAVSNLANATAAPLVATTGNLSAVVGTQTGFIKMPLSAPYTTVTGGAYIVGAYFNGGTNPVLGVMTGYLTLTTGPATFAKFPNTTASQYPFGTNGTSLTTTQPTSLTLTSNATTNGFTFWTGVS
jgi:hypothetical protein